MYTGIVLSVRGRAVEVPPIPRSMIRRAKRCGLDATASDLRKVRMLFGMWKSNDDLCSMCSPGMGAPAPLIIDAVDRAEHALEREKHKAADVACVSLSEKILKAGYDTLVWCVAGPAWCQLPSLEDGPGLVSRISKTLGEIRTILAHFSTAEKP